MLYFTFSKFYRLNSFGKYIPVYHTMSQDSFVSKTQFQPDGKMMKRGANCLLRNQIWPKLYIIKADVYILATNKFEQNQTIS